MRPERDTVTEVYEDRYKNNCFSSVSYYINEKKKVIACKIEPWVQPENPFSLFDGYGLNYQDSISRSFFEMCDEENIAFVGKATCLDEDEFNIEFGKKLAYDKAMFKLFESKRKFIVRNIKELEECIEASKTVLEDIEKQVDKVTERFEKKIKEVM